MANIQLVKQARKEYDAWLRLYPNVTSVGVGYKTKDGKRTKDVCIVVAVAKKLDMNKLPASEIIPKALKYGEEEVCTDVVEAVYKIQALTARVRPLIPGYSIGVVTITAGTLGCIVRDNERKYILSNCHVLADSGKSEIGAHIVQPGIYDGATEHDDIVGNLAKFKEIRFVNSNCPAASTVSKVFNGLSKLFGRSTQLIPINTFTNTVDCALASMSCEYVEDIYNIGKPTGTAEGTLGMKVHKSGRTTSHTEGEITQIDVTVQVSYGDQGTAIFSDQMVVTCPDGSEFSAGGDSGSAVLTLDNKLVGLLFAGGTGSTIINRIQNVFDALKITL